MKKGKLVAPIVVAVIFSLWFFSWLAICITIPEMPFLAKLIGTLVSLALIGTTIFVLVERIKEIRSGEEDDLGKY